jgi:hypothetical protein
MTRSVSDVRSIREAGIEAMRASCPGKSIEDMLCDPDLAKAICAEVRRRLSKGAKGLPDCDILRTLLNARKQGHANREALQSAGSGK